MNRKFIVTLLTIASICASIKANSEFHSQHQQSFAVNDSVTSDSTIASNDSVSAKADSVKTDDNKKKEKKIWLYVNFQVRDYITHQHIDSLECVRLLAKDSTFVDSCYTYVNQYRNSTTAGGSFDTPGEYLFKIRANGYRTIYVPFTLKKLHKHEQHREIKDVYMHRLPKEREVDLNEVVVKATKLKFYMDGDTIVYDADAFNLAEGSMLDGLIKNLPGTTLTKEGEITVNGKKVDSMLLNGKDFFDSDRNLLLENLPAYMVKNVQVFERVPEDVKGTPKEKETEKALVMNVKLKKEYNGGWIANAEGGVGMPYEDNWSGKRDTKFLGRGIVLHFDDRSRFSLFLNANNLNDYRKPGDSDGEWSPLQQSEGLTTTYKAGVNGMYEFNPAVRYQGSLSANYTEGENESLHSSANFYSTKEKDENGNEVEKRVETFSKSQYSSNNYRFNIETRNNFRINKEQETWRMFKRVFGEIDHDLQFTKANANGNNISMTLSDDVASQLGKAWLDSVMSPMAGEFLKKYAIDRDISQSKNNGHSLNTSFSGHLSATPLYNDNISFSVSTNIGYKNENSNTYGHSFLEQIRDGGKVTRQNRYAPGDNTRLDGDVSLSGSISLGKGHSVSAGYGISYVRDENNNHIYTLEKLKEWENWEDHPLGMLPSTEDMLKAMDAYNSTEQTAKSTTHRPNLGYSFSKWFRKTEMSFHFSVGLSLPVAHEELKYWRGQQADTTLYRNTTFLSPNFYMSLYKNNKIEISMNGRMGTSAPSLTYMLDVKDTLNPQYRNVFNPNLKNSTTYSLSLYGRFTFKRSFLNFGANYYNTRNQIGSKSVVDLTKNLTTSTPMNIDGNWSSDFRIGFDTPLGKGDEWRLKDDVRYGFNNSVDFNGAGSDDDVAQSIVKNHDIKNTLALTFRPSSKMEFSAKGDIEWQNSIGNLAGFEAVNAFTFNYGLTTQIELPWNMQLATDLTMYSRRGYSDSDMNRDELVWNARLSKRLMKGKFIIQLDGFDMLGNLSNVRHYIGAWGRYETFYNVIPSYCLLHAIWRFNKNPKKKE